MSEEEETAADLTGDEFFVMEAARLERDLQRIVADTSDTLTAGLEAPLLVNGWQALHFLHLAGRLLEAVALCQQISGYLTVLPELPGPEVPPVLDEEAPEPVGRQPSVPVPGPVGLQ